MFTFDLIGLLFVLIAFLSEFTLLLLHTCEKKLKKDMFANFTLGLSIMVVGLFEKGLAFGLFSLAYHCSIFTPSPSVWLWFAGFLSCELIYYLYHLLEHKVRIFWAAHVTHHSSRYFNFSVGLRNNFIFLFYRFIFWSPLCFFGIPPEMILFFESITAIQNFLIHTEKVGKLGVWDWIFNTPSNHRVHHASNPEYIDKNLGGILMLYDHLFGTYQKETAPPVYGITHNIDTNNQLEILIHEYVHVVSEISKIKTVAAKFRYLLSPPQ